MNSDELDRFVRDMVAQTHAPSLDDEALLNTLVENLKERLMDQIDRAVIDALPDDKVDGLDALIDQADTTDEQIRQYVIDAGVDTQKITINTMVRFRELYTTPPETAEG